MEAAGQRPKCLRAETYAHENPAVFAPFDLPSGGPHDEVLPIDLLALNALNGWGAGQPMTGMTEAAREHLRLPLSLLRV